jgi:hypothetical protein
MTGDTAAEVQLIFNGERLTARPGQSIAGALLASGHRSWRTTAAGRLPRGLFCGIGVCFDCLVTVNGIRDIRACQRPAAEGDVIETQDETLPGRNAGQSR